MIRWLALCTVLAAMVVGCAKRPNPEQCREICGRYMELNFWDKFEQDAADLGAGDKATLRAERQVIFDQIKAREKDPGLENCVMDCRRGGEIHQIECMKKATNGPEARACQNH